VHCCTASPLTLAPCDNDTSVAMLDLEGFGLVGELPESIADLAGLQALQLGGNPGLRGPLPSRLQELRSLLWISVQVCVLFLLLRFCRHVDRTLCLITRNQMSGLNQQL